MASRPTPPRPPRPPSLPRLRLAAIRGAGSVELDSAAVRPRGVGRDLRVPDYQKWERFFTDFEERWEQGEHVAIVGQTGSGKTTLARALLPAMPYVVIFGTKSKDDSLDRFRRQGFVVKESWSPDDVGEERVIFRPPLEAPTREAQDRQREAFRKALVGIFATGGWAIYLDEVRYLTETLGLRTELDTLWLQGRSLGITLIASTQRPVSVPLNMFEQATHFFLFRTTGRDDRLRASEYTGAMAPLVDETIVRLPRHEVLYVDAIDDHLVRTTSPAR